MLFNPPTLIHIIRSVSAQGAPYPSQALVVAVILEDFIFKVADTIGKKSFEVRSTQNTAFEVSDKVLECGFGGYVRAAEILEVVADRHVVAFDFGG